jgi:hypothetical protein
MNDTVICRLPSCQLFASLTYRSLTIPFGAGVGMMRTEKDFALTALVSGGSGDDAPRSGNSLALRR